MANDLDPAAVERAARALWEDARQEYDYAWKPNAESYRDLARKVLTAARAGEPATPTVSSDDLDMAVSSAIPDDLPAPQESRHVRPRPVGVPLAVARAQVLTEHAAHAIAAGKIGCACYHPEWMTRAEHAKHQADMLAAAGLPMTPEHDAQVAARALREWVGEWPTEPGDGTFLSDVARDGLARADRIERQEGER